MGRAGSVIAVDVGGTSIKAAVVDESGAITADRARPTDAGGGPDAVVAQLLDLIESLREVEPHVRAVGVVVPGAVNPQAGVAEFSANLGFRNLPLRQLLSDATGLTAVLDHDVRAAGVAERTVGLAAGIDDWFMAVLGTGIAAVIDAAGANVLGATNVAGEFGHIPVWPDGEACPCGGRGCLERYASAAAITRHYRELSGDTEASATDVVARRGSDPHAAQVWARATEALALGLATATMMLDPALIVLGGGLSGAGAALLDPLQVQLAERVRWREPPPIVLSALGRRAGLLGAAVLTWRSLGLEQFDSWRQAR